MKSQPNRSTDSPFWLRVTWRVAVVLGLAAYNVLRAGLLVIVAGSVMAYVGTWHKVFDFSSQLRLQFLVGAMACLPFTLGKRQWRWTGIALLAIALNFWPIVRWYGPQSPAASSARRLKLVQYNVLYQDDGYQDVLEFLRTEQPDIVTLQEINPTWAKALAPLSAQFANVRIEPEGRGNGIAIFSRIPFDQSETLDLGSDHRPNLLVKFAWEGRQISLLTTHPPNPFGENRFAWRNEQLVMTAQLMNSLPAPKILIGDLNITMWSPYYQKLVADTQLKNTRAGYGLIPTWPAQIWLPFLMIPIDHCLVSQDITVAALRTGKMLGSDHLPLIIELVIPAT